LGENTKRAFPIARSSCRSKITPFTEKKKSNLIFILLSIYEAAFTSIQAGLPSLSTQKKKKGRKDGRKEGKKEGKLSATTLGEGMREGKGKDIPQTRAPEKNSPDLIQVLSMITTFMVYPTAWREAVMCESQLFILLINTEGCFCFLFWEFFFFVIYMI